MRFRKRFAGLALAASLVASALWGPTALAGLPDFEASCGIGGSSTITNNGSATAFAWAWRTGTKVLGSGTGLVDGTKTLRTPRRATADTKFGVVRISDQAYVYPNCS